MKEQVNPKHWYKFDYDGYFHGERDYKGSCFDLDEKVMSRIMKGAYLTKELNYIFKGDVLLKHYPEFLAGMEEQA